MSSNLPLKPHHLTEQILCRNVKCGHEAIMLLINIQHVGIILFININSQLYNKVIVIVP